MRTKSLSICVLTFLAVGPPDFAQSNDLNIKTCTTIDDHSTKVVIIGDSFFTTNKGKPGSLESYLSKFIEGACVENLAKGGARFSGFGNNRIQKQKSKSIPELLIIGGGGNDFIRCGSDTSCMQKTLNKILSQDIQSGWLTKVIAQNSDSNTKIVILYPSDVTFHAPDAWKTVIKNIGQKYVSRMAKFAEKNPRVFWLDATLVAKTTVRSHWLQDGYHPSVVANMRLAKVIKKIYGGDTEYAYRDIIDLQYVNKYSCSFSIHKSGYDDEQNAYEYMQVDGELDVDFSITFEEFIIKFTRENWVISGASPTYLKDNMNDVLSIGVSGNLYGILNTYSNSKATSTVLVSSDDYVFQSSNNPQYLFEGQHTFQNPKNKDSYRFTISDCAD